MNIMYIIIQNRMENEVGIIHDVILYQNFCVGK